ncbi:lytic murein transglycosylase [Agrobacterium tumefaciens]|nr:lytic murein transglycosylase [Agrobacterium tumefaciens]
MAMRGEVSASITPLCPAGHLPHKEGDRQEARSPLHSQTLRWLRPNRESISPLRGRCPAGQRG